jgi:GNAT superfamily N-acetyltransferase
MPTDEFVRHVTELREAGYLEERDDKLRVGVSVETETTTVDVGGREATVRPARQEDIGGVVEVIESVATEETHVVASRLADELDRGGVLLRHNDRQDRVFFIATVGEAIVGWLHVAGEQFPPMGHTAELTLGVAEAYRGDGLGSELMSRGLAWAREEEYRKLYQHLPATNEGAVSFLADHGWTVEATREGHYDIDGDLIDEVQLARWLHGAGD